MLLWLRLLLRMLLLLLSRILVGSGINATVPVGIVSFILVMVLLLLLLLLLLRLLLQLLVLMLLGRLATPFDAGVEVRPGLFRLKVVVRVVDGCFDLARAAKLVPGRRVSVRLLRLTLLANGTDISVGPTVSSNAGMKLELLVSLAWLLASASVDF